MSASDDIKRPLRDGIDTVKTQVGNVAQSAGDAAHTALDKTRDTFDTARERAADAYDQGRDRATETYAAARDRARAAAADASETLESSPLLAVGAGLVIGVVVGALLPRTEREAKLYGAVGDRLTGAAREAAGAAKDAGRDKLADMGLSRDHAREGMRQVLDAAFAAVTSAGGAAIETARQRNAIPARD